MRSEDADDNSGIRNEERIIQPLACTAFSFNTRSLSIQG